MPEYRWPSPPGSFGRPEWTGTGFLLDGSASKILSYAPSVSAWTDQLTTFHEKTAGEAHFIDRASRYRALDQIEAFVGLQDGVILEVGCSSGFMLADLHERFSTSLIMGCDIVLEPLERLAIRMPGIPLLHFDLVKCPLPDASIDAIILLDVLEHIADDATALRQVHRMLKPGGVAVIEVPAGPGLYDVYDRLLMHHRRYSMAALRSLCAAAELEVVNASHLGFFLYPGFWLVKQWNKRFLESKRPSQEQVVARSITRTRDSRLFDWLMRVELALGRTLNYPFGIRCVMTCRKGW